jgi:hypothetical protein
MASINLTDEILRHTDDEIIAYLAEELAEIKRVYVRATKEKAPELLYMAAPNLNELYAVVNALNRRNEERKLK